MMESNALRVRISGLVQGVFFRAWTKEQANRLGLAGWVRNRRDGTVEAAFSGSAGKVEEMVSLCRHGPEGARVEEVEIEPLNGPTLTGFEIRPTR